MQHQHQILKLLVTVVMSILSLCEK